MLFTSFQVLLPVFFVIGLGYFAGRAKKFDAEEVKGINELVMTYALPAMMFVATVTTTRSALWAQGPYLMALLVAFVGLFIVVVIIALGVQRLALGAAGLKAILITFPSVAFYGIPIFKGLFGEASIFSIAAAGVLANITLVPMTIVMLEIHARRGANQATRLAVVARQGVISSFKKPMVWAPLLGVLLVLLDIQVPPEVDRMFSLIGSATGGASLFLAGLIIAAYQFKLSREVIGNVAGKMILQPALMLLLVYLLGIPNPLGREAVLLCAIPSSAVSAMLAARYQVYETETASTLLSTAAAMVVTYPLWVYVLGG